MRKGNLIKMAAPAILSAAMMVSGLPVMAADFTSDTAVETEAQTDEFDAADDTADAFAGDEETPFVDDQAAAEDEFAATAETGYKYVYAGLTWAQYWASEGVYNAANTASNGTKDMRTMTTNVDVMKEIVTADNDFVNNKPAMEEMAKDESYGDAVLGGQNPLAMFCAGADKIDLSNMSIYDQAQLEQRQKEWLLMLILWFP